MLARRLGAPLVFTRVSRLLVDQNRSAHNRRVFSEFTAKLSVPERARLLQRYHTEHRRSVEQAVEASLREARRVVHVAVHSFAPRLAGRVRRADVGLLYDPSRVAERAFCTRWQEALRELAPTLRVRRNYPYRGDDDGLTRHLRACHDARRYLGIELELNQALLGGDAAAVARTVSTSLEKLIETV
jgi:predicted N-formylglutamate amidohydrolase